MQARGGGRKRREQSSLVFRCSLEFSLLAWRSHLLRAAPRAEHGPALWRVCIIASKTPRAGADRARAVWDGAPNLERKAWAG